MRRGVLFSALLASGIAAAVACAGRPRETATKREPITQPLDGRARHESAQLVAAPPEAPVAPSAIPSASASTSASAAPQALAPAGDPSVRTIGTCDKPGGVRRFTLAHFNDLQARYGETINGKSRYAYIAGYLRKLKAEGPTLVLDAGDDYEKGSIAELRSMGESTRQMIQALPIDARTIGNHDFAYGEAALLRDIAMSKHPVLAANIHRGEGPGPFLPYVRIDVGCVKVGIVGLVTLGYGSDDEATHDPFFGVLHHDDSYYPILDAEVKKHRSEVDVMIALTHIGQHLDTDLAKGYGGIHFYVGGHSEDILVDLDGARVKDKTHGYVMQVGHYARYLGRADIAVHPNKGVVLERYKLVSVDESLPAADDVSDLAASLEREYAPDAHRPIATVEKEIASGAPMVELVRRAVVDQWKADGLVLGTDVFFDGLPAGPVTLQRLYDSVMVQREPSGTPGYTSLYIVAMTGAEIAQLKPKVHGTYLFLTPESLVASKTYRIAFEKRGMMNPTMPFAAAPKLSGRFAGEIIDVLEGYARGKTARGEKI